MSQNLDRASIEAGLASLLAAKGTTQELIAMTKAYGKSLNLAGDAMSEMVDALGDQEQLSQRLLRQSGFINNTQEKALQLQRLSNNLSEGAYDIANDMAQAVADQVLQQQMLETGLIGSFAEQLKNYKLALDIGMLSQSEYDSMVKKLQLQQHQTQQIEKQTEITRSLAEFQLEMNEELESYTMGWEKLKSKMKAIATDPKLARTVFAAEGMKTLLEGVKKFGEGFEKLREKGLSAGQAAEGQIKSISAMSILGLSDTQGVLEGMVDTYGNINALSAKEVDHIGHLAHEMGIAGSEAFKLQAGLSQMPGETLKTAEGAMEYAKHMSEVNGIAPGKIAADMAKNTEAMALHSKDGAKGFAKAAVEAHKMGIDIGVASKMASGLLNFEDSINSQMEASVLLGKEINLDKARELALSGDAVGASKEVLKNIGGQAEFEKMNVLQKQALAKASGMTVEELMKAADAQQEANKYSGEEVSNRMKLLGLATEYGGKTISFLKENGMLLLSGIQFITTGNAAKAAGWVAEKAHFAWEKTAALARMGWAKLTGKSAGTAGAMAGGAADKVKQAAVPKDSGKSTGGLTKSMEKINPGKLLAGAAAMVLAAAAVYVFAKAAQEFSKVSWEDMAKAGVGLLALVGAIGLVGALMMSGVGAVAILAGAAAMVVMASSLFILGKAIQEIGKGFEILTPALGVVSSLGTMVAPLFAVATALVGIAGGLTMMGIAGLVAMPAMAMLVGLAAVAPALTGLMGAMSGGEKETGGGGDDKMDTLIGKIDQLIGVASQGGTVNLDGRKVGDIVRLSINSSKIR